MVTEPKFSVHKDFAETEIKKFCVYKHDRANKHVVEIKAVEIADSAEIQQSNQSVCQNTHCSCINTYT